VPTVWITNRIEQIDPAFRRRFAYHLELKSPPPGAREALVRRALQGVEVSPPFVERLVARKNLTPAQIHTAVRFAGMVCSANPVVPPRQEMEALIERQLRNADQALGGGRDRTRPRVAETHYDLTLLNVECRFGLDRVVQALLARGRGSLCFHGPPGSGKTALAEYLAAQMGRPLMIRQASDLVSKFIGETEENMAAMFAEAEAEHAVLLLDEADSFLQDRRGAQRTYEVTEVNEMLQGMERHQGVFICTTNLMDRIDQAALRRFTFKIRFKPLNPEQRRAMFVAEALAGEAQRLLPAFRQRLDQLDQLCLGDFAAVQRQATILGKGFGPEEFLDQLEAEHRIKPEVREQRSLGFLQ
jgi:MoxR-like ATPase